MKSEEYCRHSDEINQNYLELTASSSSEDTETTIIRTDSNTESDSIDNRPVIEVDDDDDDNDQHDGRCQRQRRRAGEHDQHQRQQRMY